MVVAVMCELLHPAEGAAGLGGGWGGVCVWVGGGVAGGTGAWCSSDDSLKKINFAA